jgi:RsiW-degrading membrane proteinase PrsW (M82 family)
MGQSLTLYLISGVLALVPAVIWLTIIFRSSKKRGLKTLIFAASIFSVVPVFLLQYFLNLFPQFDVLQFLQENINNQNLNFLLLFISVGIVEELVKQSLIRFIDKHYLLIQTINESIIYSLVAALGFSFAENVFYIYSIYTQLGIQQLFVAYLFRSVFTTCAHLIFSGFFGYYYGIAKFSLNIVEQSRMTGEKKLFVRWIGDKFNISTFEAYKELTILKGAVIAICMHAFFNFLLQFNQILPVVIFVGIGFLILLALLRKKSGRLILVSNVKNGQASTMSNKDEEVVIELMGMWFKEKKYVDVIHICQRLLQRDPGNRVVELFKAKAIDQLEKNDSYGQILRNLFPDSQKKSLAAIIKEKKKQEKNEPKQPAGPSPEYNPFIKPEEPEDKETEIGFFDLKR